MRERMKFEDDVVVITHLFGHEFVLDRYVNAVNDKVPRKPVERRIKEFIGRAQAAVWAEKEWPGVQVEPAPGRDH